MSNDLDCIVVGYHHMNYDEMDFSGGGGGMGGPQLSVGLRMLLRSQLPVEGRYFDYLRALSAWYAEDRAEDPGVYSVSELPNLGTYYLTNFLRRRGHAV